MEQIKKFSFIFCLFFVIIYIPLFFSIYSTSWYKFNYSYQNTYEKLGYENSINATNNLISFFSHKNSLNKLWSKKEIIHMNDVRDIYDFIFILYLFSLGFLIKYFSKFKSKIKKYCKYNIYVLIFLIFILPVFSFFWNYIFHPILFNNDFWIINSNEISYYLFDLINYGFFIKSLLLIIIVSIIINLLLIQNSRKFNSK